MLVRAKKSFLQKFNMGIKKADFHADLKSTENFFLKCTDFFEYPGEYRKWTGQMFSYLEECRLWQ
jgi:hypothetical protein